MAWMKSASSANYFLTTELSSEQIPAVDASNVSQALGFNSVVVPSEVILAEQARTLARRAALVAEVAAAVTAPTPATPTTVTVELSDTDHTAIAQKVADLLAARLAN